MFASHTPGLDPGSTCWWSDMILWHVDTHPPTHPPRSSTWYSALSYLLNRSRAGDRWTFSVDQLLRNTILWHHTLANHALPSLARWDLGVQVCPGWGTPKDHPQGGLVPLWKLPGFSQLRCYHLHLEEEPTRFWGALNLLFSRCTDALLFSRYKFGASISSPFLLAANLLHHQHCMFPF